MRQCDRTRHDHGAVRDSADGGRGLAENLTTYADWRDVWVLDLPHGGVHPVAFEVARSLPAPLECQADAIRLTSRHA
jgi:predicted phosphoribosyltransferase